MEEDQFEDVENPIEDEKKKVGKPRFKSEWNMGAFDLTRYNNWLWMLEVAETRFWAGEMDSLNPLFSIIKMLHARFRTIMFESKKKEFDRLFEIAEKMKDDYERRKLYYPMATLPKDLKIALSELIKFFLQTKQEMGLGIPVRQDISQSLKWRRALGIGD